MFKKKVNPLIGKIKIIFQSTSLHKTIIKSDYKQIKISQKINWTTLKKIMNQENGKNLKLKKKIKKIK